MNVDPRKFAKILISSGLLLFLFCSAVFADVHTIENSEFSLSEIYSSLLYPETDYPAHPSVLSSLSRKLTLLDFSLAEDYEWEKAQRLDDSQGALGGIRLDQDFYLPGSLDALFLSPKEKGLFGFTLSGDLDYRSLKSEFSQYDSPGQSMLKETLSVPFSVGTGVLWASSEAGLRQGYTLDYDFSFRKAYFSWVTDFTQDPVLKYVEYTGDDADQYDHEVVLKGDWGKTLGNVDLTFAASYDFSYQDRNKRYILIDKDEDGYEETLLSYTDWFAAYKNLQLLADQRFFTLDQRDRTFGHRVNLDAVLRFELSKDLELLLLGTYTPLDYSVREYYDRMTTKDQQKDASWDSETRSQDWGNFSLGTIFKAKADKRGWNWRYGVSYERSAKTLVLDGVQISDINKYSRINTGRYPELSLGIDPVHGSISGADIDPCLQISHLLELQVGWEWKVAKNLRLFTSFEVTGLYAVDHYRVFNLDTDTVWEEQIGGYSLFWGAFPKVGVMLPLGEKLLAVCELTTFSFPGAYDQSADTAPYDLSVGRVSGDGAVDLTGTGNFAFDVTMKMVILP